MLNLDINTRERFVKYVMDTIVKDYRYTEIESQEMVMSSALLELLDEEPEYVMHYSIQHWAKQVIDENTCVCV